MTVRLRRTRVVASAGLLIAGAWGMGMALFTDTETVTANVFSAGTLDLTAAPATALISYADMAPGDMVTAPLTVTNSGSLDLRYSMAGAQTAGDPGLGAALSVDVKAGVAACTNAGFGLSGSALASGTLAASSFGDAAADPTTCLAIELDGDLADRTRARAGAPPEAGAYLLFGLAEEG